MSTSVKQFLQKLNIITLMKVKVRTVVLDSIHFCQVYFVNWQLSVYQRWTRSNCYLRRLLWKHSVLPTLICTVAYVAYISLRKAEIKTVICANLFFQSECREPVHTQSNSLGSYMAKALFSIRSCSCCIFCPYSLSLISQTFLMMEASQPTTSGFLSLDIFKLLQTSCTHR